MPSGAGRALGTTRATVADRDGRFAIDDLIPGRYRVEVAHGGAEPLRSDEFVLAPGERRDVGKLALQPGFPVTGRVVDESGAPIDGARVVVGVGRRVGRVGGAGRGHGCGRQLRAVVAGGELPAGGERFRPRSGGGRRRRRGGIVSARAADQAGPRRGDAGRAGSRRRRAAPGARAPGRLAGRCAGSGRDPGRDADRQRRRRRRRPFHG